jgi:hypothetical protein
MRPAAYLFIAAHWRAFANKFSAVPNDRTIVITNSASPPNFYRVTTPQGRGDGEAWGKGCYAASDPVGLSVSD